MISPGLAHPILFFIVTVSILLMLIRPGNIAESYWIGAGVLLLLLLRLVNLNFLRRGLLEAADVCFFLIGMMLLSELAREQGVFDWLSSVAARHADGSRLRLFASVYLVGTMVTVFLSNDATAVVLTPAILTAVRKAKVEPLPYLFVCAFIANAASFVLPISNPANLVVFHGQMPALTHWLISFGVPSLLSILATFLVLRWLFRNDLRAPIPGVAEPHPLSANGKLVLAGLAAMLVVLLAASTLGKDLGLPACLAALVITAVVSLKTRSNPWILARGISWETLALVVGLFVMVDAVEATGAMQQAGTWLLWAQHLGPYAGTVVTGFTVGIANNLVNNLPLGLLAGSALQVTHVSGVIADAVLVGVDLGPNLSITGSLATILWLIALRKERIHVSFWTFLKLGVIVMPVALLASLGGTILMKLLLHS